MPRYIAATGIYAGLALGIRAVAVVGGSVVIAASVGMGSASVRVLGLPWRMRASISVSSAIQRKAKSRGFATIGMVALVALSSVLTTLFATMGNVRAAKTLRRLKMRRSTAARIDVVGYAHAKMAVRVEAKAVVTTEFAKTGNVLARGLRHPPMPKTTSAIPKKGGSAKKMKAASVGSKLAHTSLFAKTLTVFAGIP